MSPMKSWRSLWLTSLLGLLISTVGCTTVVMSPRPYRCPPLTPAQRDEYKNLVTLGEAPALRAWIRETEKVCRANAALLHSE